MICDDKLSKSYENLQLFYLFLKEYSSIHRFQLKKNRKQLFLKKKYLITQHQNWIIFIILHENSHGGLKIMKFLDLPLQMDTPRNQLKLPLPATGMKIQKNVKVIKTHIFDVFSPGNVKNLILEVLQVKTQKMRLSRFPSEI